MGTPSSLRSIAVALAAAYPLAAGGVAAAQTPPELTTPDKVETSIGTLEFKDGAPSPDTIEKARDALDLNHALAAYLNSYGGASAYALCEGFHGIGVEDNSVIVFPKLMDSNSLFLTANADTVYYMACLDLTKGPVVVEQPPKSVGTINDMWFQWVVDIGFPGPDRGEGGKYLIVPPGYDGPLPDGGFFVGRAKTKRALYASRAYLVDGKDPKPAVDMIHDTMKIYPYAPGGYGTSIVEGLAAYQLVGEVMAHQGDDG